MTFVVADAVDTAKTVDPNAVECHDCGTTWTGPEIERWDTCPSNPDHAASPAHVTREPLGVGNDEDFLVVMSGTYIYTLEEK